MPTTNVLGRTGHLSPYASTCRTHMESKDMASKRRSVDVKSRNYMICASLLMCVYVNICIIFEFEYILLYIFFLLLSAHTLESPWCRLSQSEACTAKMPATACATDKRPPPEAPEAKEA